MKLSRETIGALENLFEAQADDFIVLVEVAGLDPKIDFEYKDLSDLDLTALDLRNFSFRNSNLKNCILKRSLIFYDSIRGADMEGAVYSEMQFIKPKPGKRHLYEKGSDSLVLCFAPDGHLIVLPRGATPVDFAYAIHSQVGDNCVGAKINGRMMQLRTQLQNGDQVEIVTSKTQTPSPSWERFVVTSKAKACIRRFLRLQQRAQYLILGKALVQKLWRQEDYDLTEKALKGVLKIFQEVSVDDLYAAVGAGLQSPREVFKAVYPSHKFSTDKDDAAAVDKLKAKDQNRPPPIRGLIPGMAVHYASCCHPLPGDRIVGIVTTGRGVTIHTIDCETLEIFDDTPERWIDLAWDVGHNSAEDYIGRISVLVANEPGGLGELTSTVGKSGGNITNLKIVDRNQDFFEIMVDIYVKDARHLNDIIRALGASRLINSVERVRGIWRSTSSKIDRNAITDTSDADISHVEANTSPLPIRGLIPGMAVHYARCCHPLPGDRIVGIVTTGKGVAIHTIDCETLDSFYDTPERWIDVAWDVAPNSPEYHIGRIAVLVANEPGGLGELTSTIGKCGGNVTNLKIVNRSQDSFEIMVEIDVKDAKHLTNIIAALRASRLINSVERRWSW